ncbi:MAG: hypothetical protein AB4038_19260 [Prochloraceae cyanobacterium]
MPTYLAVIQSLSRRPVTQLNSFEEQILSLAEAGVVVTSVKHMDPLDSTLTQERVKNNSSVGEMAVSLVQSATDAEEIIRAISLKYPDILQKVLSDK